MKEKNCNFLYSQNFLIKLVTLNGIVISTIQKLHSKLSQKNLFRCFQALRSVLVDSNEIKLTDSLGP